MVNIYCTLQYLVHRLVLSFYEHKNESFMIVANMTKDKVLLNYSQVPKTEYFKSKVRMYQGF